MQFEKPRAEVLVEGELSPFEDEAMYRILRRNFKVESPSYAPFTYGGDDLSTRVNIIFHYPYTQEFFTKHLGENWRQLKDLMKNVRYRRGNAGAAFNLTFIDKDDLRIIFHSGSLGNDEIGSAIDQVGYLTGIIARMLKPGTLPVSIGRIDCTFDKWSDRWAGFQAVSKDGTVSYRFNEETLSWDPGEIANYPPDC